jgi:hypothetical protein
MRDRNGPPTSPLPWPAVPPAYPGQAEGGVYDGRDWDPDYLALFDEPAGEARRQGLRRLSKLTWRATQLSAVAAVGFAALFGHTAHAQTVSTPAPAKPSVKPVTASPAPSPSPARKKKRHHKAPAGANPGSQAGSGSSVGSGSAGSSSSSAGSGAGAAPALAPPTTAPAAPPPSSAPAQTTSSGSTGGG